MGTSASNSGPNDKTPLLPAWAQGGPSPAPDEPGPQLYAPDGQDLPAQPVSGLPSQLVSADPVSPADGNPAQQHLPRGPWSLARRAMSSVATGGGGQRRLKVAGGRYVVAKGGATKAAKLSAAGRAT